MHDNVLRALGDAMGGNDKVRMLNYIIPQSSITEFAHGIKRCMCTDAKFDGCDITVLQNGDGSGDCMVVAIKTFCASPTLLISSMSSTSTSCTSIMLVAMERESDHKACNAFVRNGHKNDVIIGKRIILFLGRKRMKAMKDCNVIQCNALSPSCPSSMLTWVQKFVGTSRQSNLPPVDTILDLIELVCITHYSVVANFGTLNSFDAKEYFDDVLGIIQMLCRCEHNEEDKEEDVHPMLDIRNVQSACTSFYGKHMVVSGNRKPRLVRLDLLAFKTTL